MIRRCRFVLPLALLAAAFAQAETPLPEPAPKEGDPRPGQRWVDARPEIGLREIRVLEGGRELKAWILPPGEEIKFLISGENRLLVQARLQMESRTSPEASYSIGWTVDGGAEQRKEFRTKPHKTATFESGMEGVPGIPGAGVPGIKREAVVEIPTDGSHAVIFRLPEGATASVVVRVRYEQPERAGKSYGSTIGPKSHKETWWMGTVSRLTIGYDDNVFRFSDEDSHQWEELDGNDAQDKYDRVTSVGDVYIDSDLDAHIISPEFALGRFYVGGTLKNRWYLGNHHKTRDEYGLFFRHLISNSLSYKVFGTWGPDKYYRDLNPSQSPGPSRAHAHHDDYEIGGLVRMKWAPQITTGLKYTWELRDWNTNFNEKDAKIHHLDFDLVVSPAKWISFELDLDGSIAHALAGGGERDASYRQFSPKLAVDFRVKRLLFGASYGFDSRVYTTDNSRQVDPAHAHRRDKRHTFGIYAGYQLGESSEITLAYSRTKRTVQLPGRESSTDPSDFDDDFEYTSNSLELTLLFKWP
ncbi:MAG: hypothetical protein AAB074_00425 [Planctomycetota bacterium]